MTTADYQVRLDAFQGPLDLLLFLIRKNEVDVHDIPIASITDQFLRYIDDPDPRTGLATLDVEAAGEFLVMAATLVEIKSRMLAPARGPDEVAAEGDNRAAGGGPRGDRQSGDPRAELVRQLLAYKKFRDAAGELDARHQLWSDRHPNAPAALPTQPNVGPGTSAADGEGGSADPAGPDGGAVIDTEDLQVIDLVEAFARIMATVDFSRVGEHHVHDDETPIELHQADILDVLARTGPSGEGVGVPLRSVFEGRTKPEAIGLFLALLELIRQRRVVICRTADAELSLSAPPPAPATSDAPPA